jgi:protocatechuate 4,5-dioxygenase beta chain
MAGHIADKDVNEMAEIVAGFGMPHNPGSPAMVARDGPQCETARLYAEMGKHIEAAKPDVLVIFTDDHFNTFFLDNFPTFAVGIAEATSGPNDQTPMPRYTVAVPGELAAHIRGTALAHGFDISLVQDFEVDHAVMVPLHFITPQMKIPVVPIFVNCLAPPLPTARRCYALGEAVRAAVESWPKPLRVAVLGSGSFSLEIGGPRIPPGPRCAGTPDPQWSQHVQDLLGAVRIDDLIAEATPARMQQAGNIGGELLNWIATLGVIGARKPVTMLPQNDHGQAFAVWRWN